uniref:Indoleamine 2,3-dioxygenase n=1 Tax=Chromera velia CCMP2878 TaxID=1169474 RepID=A0A0G4FMN3_9ALVE|eukprot:Cvel_17827.t1-p1 / transcript=Cvel_17827.t1 / gene=Cvel_17827 / organism=Chromera_velia_CCMP2878 / gene_product=Indoleamine 2,3-dioxygenase 1, putative / transcript_product=Indoleamine 2,3-dioxygenase 1, putative / location=Cvel_scaffold1444:39541-42171(+) / protein_length=634 / sequence_SO=supercontig / SO=protein_coding / is_pseudo=false
MVFFKPLEFYGLSRTNGFIPFPSACTSLIPLEAKEKERDVSSDSTKADERTREEGFAANHQFAAPWERLAENLPEKLKGGISIFRKQVEALPLIDLEKHLPEMNVAAKRRAYVLLSVLAHAYVWGDDPESGSVPEIMPEPVARPWYTICRELGMPCVVTHAALDLWNWTLKDPSQPPSLENMRNLLSFTGHSSEEWFHLISAAAHGLSAPLLCKMYDVVRSPVEPFNELSMDGGGEDVVECLEQEIDWKNCAEHPMDLQPSECVELLKVLKQVVEGVTSHIKRMYERCEPEHFYKVHRFFFRGWDASSGHFPSGGLILEGVSSSEGGDGEYLKVECRGASAGQSALIQLFDVLLSVRHGTNQDAASSGQVVVVKRGTLPVSESGEPEGRALNSNDIRSETTALTTRKPGDGVEGGQQGQGREDGEEEDGQDSEWGEEPPPPAPRHFLSEMRDYMPRGFRQFLDDSVPLGQAVRACVEKGAKAIPRLSPESAECHELTELVDCYNETLTSLGNLRSAHMGLAYRYIVAMAKQEEREKKEKEEEKKEREQAEKEEKEMEEENQEEEEGEEDHHLALPARDSSAVSALSAPEEPVVGTGGSDLIKFLKSVRQDVNNTSVCVDSPAKSLKLVGLQLDD